MADPNDNDHHTRKPPSPAPLLDDAGFPQVQPGGSLLIAWQVRNKPVLVVGGGNVAAGRILSLLNADAVVHVACPSAGLNPEVAHRIHTDQVHHHDTPFHPTLLDSIRPSMVLTAIDDPAASSAIYSLCHRLKVPVNVADVPPECDFYFGSVHRDGPLQVMVSTNGNGPKLANIVRRQIAHLLPESWGEAITKVGQLRKRLRRVAPDIGDGQKRMEWMSRVCEEWTLAELCEMGEEEMLVLLEGYKLGKVVMLDEMRGPPEDDWKGEQRDPDVFEEAFDGSFGWF